MHDTGIAKFVKAFVVHLFDLLHFNDLCIV